LKRALATVSNSFALAPEPPERRIMMQPMDKIAGVYTPEDLKEMTEELNREIAAGGMKEKEARAATIINRVEQRRSSGAA
jgi:hypothetical protein